MGGVSNQGRHGPAISHVFVPPYIYQYCKLLRLVPAFKTADWSRLPITLAEAVQVAGVSRHLQDSPKADSHLSSSLLSEDVASFYSWCFGRKMACIATVPTRTGPPPPSHAPIHPSIGATSGTHARLPRVLHPCMHPSIHAHSFLINVAVAPLRVLVSGPSTGPAASWTPAQHHHHDEGHHRTATSGTSDRW